MSYLLFSSDKKINFGIIIKYIEVHGMYFLELVTVKVTKVFNVRDCELTFTLTCRKVINQRIER